MVFFGPLKLKILTRFVISSIKSIVVSLMLEGIMRRKERNSKCKAINETASKCFLESSIQASLAVVFPAEMAISINLNICLGNNLSQQVLVK